MTDILICALGRTRVYSAPKLSAELESEMIYGQSFRPISESAHFIYGEVMPLCPLKSGSSSYPSQGYVRRKALKGAGDKTADYKITALQAPVFTRLHIKAPIKARLPFGARLRLKGEYREFVKIDHGINRGQYVHRRHISKVDVFTADFVAAAERHMGLPYIWGGVSTDGLDCSGLVQSALWAAGRGCPRNSGEQKAALGKAVDIGAPLMRGDLVFWKGHVGIMQDAERLLHANAFHMCTASEPLNAAAQRIEKSAGPISAIKRL